MAVRAAAAEGKISPVETAATIAALAFCHIQMGFDVWKLKPNRLFSGYNPL
jgi:hypothetical protein